MSYYRASGLHDRLLLPQASRRSPDQDATKEHFIGYLFSRQVFVEPQIDLFTKTKFMELKRKKINKK